MDYSNPSNAERFLQSPHLRSLPSFQSFASLPRSGSYTRAQCFSSNFLGWWPHSLRRPGRIRGDPAPRAGRRRFNHDSHRTSQRTPSLDGRTSVRSLRLTPLTKSSLRGRRLEASSIKKQTRPTARRDSTRSHAQKKSSRDDTPFFLQHSTYRNLRFKSVARNPPKTMRGEDGVRPAAFPSQPPRCEK